MDNLMYQEITKIALITVTLGLSLFLIFEFMKKVVSPFTRYVKYLWVFFTFFCIVEIFSFSIGIWLLAIMSFWSLREYFSLVDIRLQDRWGIMGAYLSIPFMFYYIQSDWYGMFVVSIPVYSFLAIPFLLAIGGKPTKGIVFSIGAIDLGIFLFVYCLGHIGYLSLFSIRVAMILILNIVVCDILAYCIRDKIQNKVKDMAFRLFVPLPFTSIVTLLLSKWTNIPPDHSIVLGLMIPVLIVIGNYTIKQIEADLGITKESLSPGKGEVIDNIKSVFYTAPVVFHYIRYFLDEYNL